MDLLTKTFKAVANERRVKILWLLREHKELPVSEIAGRMNMSIKTASHHLLKMENVGLVKRRPNRLWAFYSLNFNSKNRFNQKILGIFQYQELVRQKGKTS